MRFDVVVFDIDNVLVDTRASYTDCIRKTVQIYYEKILKLKHVRASLLTRSNVEWFKSLGGFNDDWDTCYGLLLYLTTPRLLSSPRKNGGRIKVGGRKPLGVKGAEKLFGKNQFVSIKKIAAIFQPLYLKHFHKKEKLLIPKSFLARLKHAGIRTGVVTGRNQHEARMAFRRFGIARLIDTMITTDETPKGLKKPNPYGLLQVAKKLGRDLRYLYVGDIVDDILAARAAKKKMQVKSCAYLAAASTPNETRRQLRHAGANFICSTPAQLKQIILPTSR